MYWTQGQLSQSLLVKDAQELYLQVTSVLQISTNHLFTRFCFLTTHFCINFPKLESVIPRAFLHYNVSTINLTIISLDVPEIFKCGRNHDICALVYTDSLYSVCRLIDQPVQYLNCATAIATDHGGVHANTPQ